MMRGRFDEQLNMLHTALIEMGAMIERGIESASQALVNRDVELARPGLEFFRPTGADVRGKEARCRYQVRR